MALKVKHKEIEFGVGDTIRVFQDIQEGKKTRKSVFEGMVIGIKGRDVNRSFTVRRIGEGQVGIERIFPLESPTIEEIEVTRHGTRGVRRAKLYYTRKKARKEVERIYSRATSREIAKKKAPKSKKTATPKKDAPKKV